MKNSLLFLAVILMTLNLRAQDFSAYEKSSFVFKGDTLPYRILFPKSFDPSKEYPVLVYLHGSGESGNDNEAQLIHGGKLFVADNFRETYPSIVIFPQCAKSSFWSNVKLPDRGVGETDLHFQIGGKPTKSMRTLVAFMDNFVAKPFVDHNRIYVGGSSMGGMGTFEILRRRPKMFAAAFPICAGDNVKNVKKYKKVPIWIFHGIDDNVVPVSLSQSVADALKAGKAKEVKLSLYPGVGHNSWDNAFAEPELFPWLFSKRR
jgi:predicted peptidase